MRAYTNEQLHQIAGENYRILCGYCTLLEEEGYWEHPKQILKRPILDFLTLYVQAVMLHLACYSNRKDEPTQEFISSVCDADPFLLCRRGFCTEVEKESKQLVMAPPILLQLCSLRDVEKKSSLTGMFFDAILNILFSEAYLDGRREAAVTAYVSDYYKKVQVFIENANKKGACVDEKYIFRKICMGELHTNTKQLKKAGDNFSEYLKDAFYFSEPKEEIEPVPLAVKPKEPAEPIEPAEQAEQEELTPSMEPAEPTEPEKLTLSMESVEPPESSAPVDFLAARLSGPLRELNELVGLTEVKEEIHSLINLIRVRKLRTKAGLPSMPMSYHMVFSGNPGTGKTTVARLIGRIYKELGILSRGNMIETDRAGLVAGYVGQTALKVQEVIEKAKGGILFIDEAYTLSNKLNDNDFGTEAIDTLVKAMEDYREDLVIIVAGYTKEMEQFLKANTGLQSRFNKFIFFADYNDEMLMEILDSMASKAGFFLEESAKEHIKQLLSSMSTEEKNRFGNARGIRNLFEKLVSAQANRVIDIVRPTKEQLCAITLEDCRQIH